MSCLDLEQRESQKETGDSLSPHIYYGSQEVPASKPGVEWTRLVCLSDTHNKIDANTKGFIVPVGDVLIHAGDLTKNGTVGQIHATFDWLKGLPHRYKIIIAGNHDLTLDPPFYEKNWHRFHRNKENSAESLKIVRNTKNGIVYLEDESYTIPECGYKVFGSPWSPEFCEWAFNAKRGEECQKVWAKIPLDTQILITHGPPYKILDKTFQDLEVGCPDLLERVGKIKPLIHVFGHIHEGFGVLEREWPLCSSISESNVKRNSTIFVNASSVNLKYRPVNTAIVIDLPPLSN